MNHKEQAKTAIDMVLDIFQHTPMDASWSPKFIDLKSGILKSLIKSSALKTIEAYFGYTAAKKWGVDLEIKHGDWGAKAFGSFNVVDGVKSITMRVTNVSTWLHELCHVACFVQDPQHLMELLREKPKFHPDLETEATLGAAALTFIWTPLSSGTLRRCFDCIKYEAGKAYRDPIEHCKFVRPYVQRQVTMILETMEGACESQR